MKRAEFLGMMPALKKEEVQVPECGENARVWIMQLTAGDMEEISKESNGPFDTTIRTIAACTVDGDGERIFASRDEVAKLPSPVFTRLSSAVNSVNDFKKPEEVAKN